MRAVPPPHRRPASPGARDSNRATRPRASATREGAAEASLRSGRSACPPVPRARGPVRCRPPRVAKRLTAATWSGREMPKPTAIGSPPTRRRTPSTCDSRPGGSRPAPRHPRAGDVNREARRGGGDGVDAGPGEVGATRPIRSTALRRERGVQVATSSGGRSVTRTPRRPDAPARAAKAATPTR